MAVRARRRLNRDEWISPDPPAGTWCYLVALCALADQEHRARIRQYAHTWHQPATICIARAFCRLPEAYRYGILLHEFGHLLAPEADEQQADLIAWAASGIPIERRDSEWGENLERVPEPYLDAAREWLSSRVVAVDRLFDQEQEG